ncbi:hypothetical protein HPB52_024515 [Rhipicephalus sanguineus]|uniref:Uncharacterized protein n=1 Tax=Rhipicephalus sanguineus TaxID=34632 RepID=A0A9D4YS20_RHISA|nr:hypothetical protein HPB52_024515 [Rhipicephalus sanguineus]
MAATTEEMESSADDLEATTGASATPNEEEDATYEDAGFAADKTGWKMVTSRKTKKKERAETAVQPSQQENHPSGGQYEVSAYEAAPSDTCKGVVRHIDAADDHRTIDSDIVNNRNPTALAAKRIKNSGLVIVVFDGLRVPNFVRYGPTLHDDYERDWSNKIRHNRLKKTSNRRNEADLRQRRRRAATPAIDRGAAHQRGHRPLAGLAQGHGCVS